MHSYYVQRSPIVPLVKLISLGIMFSNGIDIFEFVLVDVVSSSIKFVIFNRLYFISILVLQVVSFIFLLEHKMFVWLDDLILDILS